MRRSLAVAFLVGSVVLVAGSPLSAQLAPEADAFVRKTYLNRSKVLRVEAGALELGVALSPGQFRGPARPTDPVAFRPGDVVRIGEVSSDGRSVRFVFSSAAAAATGAVRFSFSDPQDPLLARGEELLAAAAAVFEPIASYGPTPEETDKPEDDPKRPKPGAEEDSDAEESPEPEVEVVEELRLLVEAGRSVLKGDGDDTTTLTITLRDADGRIVESRNGPVEVRITCGRLVPARPVMVRGRAVANLTAPIYGDEDRALDRSIELSVLIMNRIARFRGGDAKGEILKVAREAPYAELRSPAKGDKPEILVVVEAFGVKGKGRVELTGSSTPRDGVSGTYEGKDVLGAAEWIFEGNLGKGTLRQKGYLDVIPVEASNETGGMGFVGLSVGGLGTSARPLPGGRFFLIAPPILFHRVRAAAIPGAVPKEEPKPSVTLTARKNPIAGDGESTTEVVFQYLDETGHPVGGLLLEWGLDRHGVFPANERGTLVAAQGRSGEDGIARAVYRAPSLSAGDMQQTGTVRNRDVTATYAGPKGQGKVTCNIGLLRAASLLLVVEKPGVGRVVFPLQVGSLNGTITGTVLLENVPPHGPGAAASFPLADAVVKLDGDQRILKWAAVDAGRTDSKGRFRIRMRMENWERWDKVFEKPLVVRASPTFLHRLSQCRKHLEQWPASPEVLFEKSRFLYGAQEELASLKAAEASGLHEKLLLTGLLVMTLKDARKDGSVAAEELLSHGKDLFVGVASWFWADSQLQKAISKRIKVLEGQAGIRELRRKYARWLRGEGTPIARRILAWLSAKIGLETDLPKDGLGVRSAFRKVLVPKLLEALSKVIAEWTPETSLGKLATEAMLLPYVERGNRILLAFLRNRDYLLVASTASKSEARLSVNLAWMGVAVQRVSAWRLFEATAKAFVDAGTEWVTLSMKVSAALTLNSSLWELAGKIDKAKEFLDTGVAGVRMGVEWHRLAGILAAAEEEARECVVLSAGVALPEVSLGLPAGSGVDEVLAAGLFSAGGAGDTAPPDFAALLDSGQVARSDDAAGELLARLSLAREVSDAWLIESLPSLLVLKASRPSEAADLGRGLERWNATLEAARLEAVATASGSEGRLPAAIAASVETEARTWQKRRDAAWEKLRALPLEDGGSRLAEAEALAARRSFLRGPRLGTVAAVVGGLLALLLLLLGGVALARTRARRSGSAYPYRMVSFPSKTAGVREPSPRGAVGPHILDNLGEIYLLDSAVLTIGTARENNVVARLPGVSRHHARIVREGGGTFWLEDVGSRYGSTLNGAVVTKTRLSHGDEIAMGGWRATVNLE